MVLSNQNQEGAYPEGCVRAGCKPPKIAWELYENAYAYINKVLSAGADLLFTHAAKSSFLSIFRPLQTA